MQSQKQISNVSPLVEAWLGVVYVQIDKKEKAQEVLDELIKRSKKAYVSPYHIATVYFALGENDQGFQWLNKAYEEKDYWLLWLKIEPFFDNIRQDPRYKELLKIIGLE